MFTNPTRPPDPPSTETTYKTEQISTSTQYISPSSHQNFTKIETETPETFKDISKSWSRTQAPVRNVQHPPNLQQCHPSLRVFLMPSNSTDFNQILNRDPKHLQGHIPIMIKDISPSQERPSSFKPPAMSSIFESVPDAFKLNRF